MRHFYQVKRVFDDNWKIHYTVILSAWNCPGMGTTKVQKTLFWLVGGIYYGYNSAYLVIFSLVLTQQGQIVQLFRDVGMVFTQYLHCNMLKKDQVKKTENFSISFKHTICWAQLTTNKNEGKDFEKHCKPLYTT